jgi:CubicO group peptidase (beta-lactamase class C family)
MGLNLIMRLLFFILCIPFTTSSQNLSINHVKLSHDIKQIIQKTNSTGTSIVITNKKRTIYEDHFGKADVKNNISVTGETLFGLGSITKTFTSLAILKLVDAGKLNLNDNVMDIAPELPIINKWNKDHPVRIVHLLEHTSGFDEVHPKDRTITVSDDDYPLFKSITQVKNSLIIRWEPGSRFAYSNVGYLVAGYIIEKVSGKAYNDFIKTEVLSVLEMNQSAIRLNEINVATLAKSYASNRTPLPFARVFTRPTASLYSSANDMSNFLIMLLNKGKINKTELISNESFDDFETHHSIQLFQQTENGYRLGIFPRFYKGTKWYGHGGAFNGYKTEFEYCHSMQLGIYVASSGPNATRTVNNILEIIHQQLDTEEKVVAVNTTNVDLDSFTGYYIPISPRNQLLYPFTELLIGGLMIKNKNDQLFISELNGTPIQLYGVDSNKLSHAKNLLGYHHVFDTSKHTLLTSLGFTYKRKSLILMIGLILTISTSLVFILLSQLILTIRIIKMIWKHDGIRLKAQTLLETSSLIFLIGTITFFISITGENIHQPNTASIAFFLSTMIYPVLSFIGLMYLIKDWLKIKSTLSKCYLVSLTTSLLFSITYLAYWNFIGLRIWIY